MKPTHYFYNRYTVLNRRVVMPLVIPNSQVSLLEEALECHQRGEITTARKKYWQGLEQDLDNGELLYFNARAAYEAGSLYEAEALVESATMLFPDAAQAWALLATIQAELGWLDAARTNLNKAKTLSPDLAEVHLGDAQLLLAEKAYVNAFNICRHGRRKYPELEVEFVVMMGSILYHVGKLTRASEYFQAVLNVLPGHRKAALTQATIFLQLGDMKRVLALCLPLVKDKHNLSPLQLKTTYELMVRAYLYDDNYELAQRCRELADVIMF